MEIKEIKAKPVLDSRGGKTIEVSVNGCRTSAPSGKSRGSHEKDPFKATIAKEAGFIRSIKIKSLPSVNNFNDLKKIENLFAKKIGANSLYCLEASILKALSKEKKIELWQLLNPAYCKMPKILSNIIGGGAHSSGKKPDFQEFLVIGNKKTNLQAYIEAKRLLHAVKKNEENAWQTNLANEQVLEIMKYANLEIGLDAAATQFYKKGKYHYKNTLDVMTRKEQIEYVVELIRNYKIKYLEDPLFEEDFRGFAEVLKESGKKCLVAGDDLTVTSIKRVKKAISMSSVNCVVIKPNQTGSLLEVKEVVDLCRKNNIKTIMSHRSGETIDDTIADLSVGFGCDFLKIPVSGKERIAKINRLEEIRKKIKCRFNRNP